MEKKAIIVLGIAPCLEQDLEFVETNFSLSCFDFMAIGLDCSDRVLFDIQHAASYHPDEFPLFEARRKKVGGNLDYKTHSHQYGVEKITKKNILIDHIWPLVDAAPYSGSSSFLGAQACVGMGYEKVILCGCPLKGQIPIGGKNDDYSKYQRGWQKHAKGMFGYKVKSVSGWTQEYLGLPDLKWLKQI